MKDGGIIFLFLTLLLIAGCSPSQTVMPEPQGLPPALPTQGDFLPMTPSIPGLQDMIASAKEDLAKRLSIPIDGINVLESAGVTWPDASLGCPQKGMLYAQVLTPGYLILLEYAGVKYEYHAGRNLVGFYCPNPSPPIPGAPGDY